MNTIFLSIIAMLVITGLMSTCYCWGYEEGRQKGAMESDIENCQVVVEKIVRNLEEHGDEFIESVCDRHDEEYQNKRHVITHADLAAFEQEQNNKQKEQVK
jgi:hypothetical protein